MTAVIQPSRRWRKRWQRREGASRAELHDGRHRSLQRLVTSYLPPAPAGARDAVILAGLGLIVADTTSLTARALTALRAAGHVVRPPATLALDVGPDALSTGTGDEPAPGALERIGIGRARELGLDGEGVLIGVLDTGIQASHPQFAARHVHFREFDAGGNPAGNTAADPLGHGTQVCGLLAGKTFGVASGADLAVARVLTRPAPAGFQGSEPQVKAGLNWLLTTTFGDREEAGCDVICASLAFEGFNEFLFDDLEVERVDSGTVMVAGIGNGGQHGSGHHCSPGNYPNVIGVGALNVHGVVSAFSSWGPVAQTGSRKPDLCAPGEELTSSVPGGGHRRIAGTSFAAPLVAGACALLIQRDPSLRSSAAALTNALMGLVEPVSGDPRMGAGRLNLSRL